MSRTYRRQKGNRQFADNNLKNRQNGWHYTPFWRNLFEPYVFEYVNWNGKPSKSIHYRIVGVISAPVEIPDRTKIIRKFETDGICETPRNRLNKECGNSFRRQHAKNQFAKLKKIQNYEDMHFISRGREENDCWYDY